MHSELGKKYGRWTTTKFLGGGGQGEVYLATETLAGEEMDGFADRVSDALLEFERFKMIDQRVNQAQKLVDVFKSMIAHQSAPTVALKVLRPAPGSSAPTQKAIERMKLEVAILSKVHHESLVRIVDQKLDEGGWFAMEYFPLGTLSAHLNATRGDVLASLLRIRPVIQAVAQLHSANFVHRDIKPLNVFVRENGRLALGDCGLGFDVNSHDRLTSSGEKVGTTDFMPPWAMGEIRKDEVRPAFDVFSLGKLIWCMISGKPVLRLWYWRDENHPEFDLEKLFPRDSSMRWLRPILKMSIVEREQQCLNDAGELLGRVDEVIGAMSRGGQIVGIKNYPVRCLVCGIGSYMRAQPDTPDVRLICSYCGNMQIFASGANLAAWQED